MSTLWTPGADGQADEPVGNAPTPEEQQLAAELAAMQDELAQAPAETVIANHVIGLFQLAAIHLNRQPPNLEDGQLAIDAMAALVEGLQGRLGEEEPALRDALTQLRLAYVTLAKTAAGE
jgi:hypothetical protein